MGVPHRGCHTGVPHRGCHIEEGHMGTKIDPRHRSDVCAGLMAMGRRARDESR